MEVLMMSLKRVVMYSMAIGPKCLSMIGDIPSGPRDFEMRISLHSLVETCQYVNKYKEDRLIIHTSVTNLHL